jgi:adenosine 3'-phospho 5'-phosphosulfate transporter B3
MGLSNSSLSYLSYPSQVVFKSCKLIPVMVGGMLIQRKQYSTLSFVASGLLSLGLIVFTLADVSVSPTYSVKGVLLISGALCADAAIGNVQEKTMKGSNVRASEMIYQSYSLGSVLVLLVCLLHGEMGPATALCADAGWINVAGPIVLFSVCGYLGLNVVLELVQTYGALTTVIVTNLRKAVSIIISFVFFPKPFVWGYLWGGLILMAGISLNFYANQKEKARCSGLNQTFHSKMLLDHTPAGFKPPDVCPTGSGVHCLSPLVSQIMPHH